MSKQEFDEEGALEEVNEVLSAPVTEQDTPYNVTISGRFAFDLATQMYMRIYLTRKVVDSGKRFFFEQEGSIPPEELERYHPESPYFLIYQQLADQIRLRTDDEGNVRPSENLPQAVSLALSLRDMDLLNTDILGLIESPSRVFGTLESEKPKGEESYNPTSDPLFTRLLPRLAGNISDFINLNTAFLKAGAPPRPVFSGFVRNIGNFVKEIQL